MTLTDQNSERAERPAYSPPRKAPPWGERLAKVRRSRRHYRLDKMQASKIAWKRSEYWAYYDFLIEGQATTLLLEPKFFQAQAHTGLSQALRQADVPQFVAGALKAWTISYDKLFDLAVPAVTSQEVEVESLEVIRNPEFNVNQAIWLAASETAKSIGQQDLKGWIFGGAVAAIAWALGGLSALIISAIALAAANSIVLILTDIKQGKFGATRTLSNIVQFLSFMGLIALGRFADYGAGEERMIIVRSCMAALVIAVCFWRSFRGLVLLVDLKGFDELIDRVIDLVVDWINQRRNRR